jgi:hypothetical protein
VAPVRFGSGFGSEPPVSVWEGPKTETETGKTGKNRFGTAGLVPVPVPVFPVPVPVPVPGFFFFFFFFFNPIK